MKSNKLLEVAFKVKRGSLRKKVFVCLDRPMMPCELVRKLYGSNSNTYFNLVSRALIELKKFGVVKVLNPTEKTGRIYVVTLFGQRVRKLIEKLSVVDQPKD